MGPRDEVELAKGGFDVVGVPPVPVLNESTELALVPVDRGPLVPAEIGPAVFVELVLMVGDSPEELEGGGTRVGWAEDVVELELLGKPVGPTDPVLKGPADEEAPVGPNEPPEPVPGTPGVEIGVPEPILMGPRLN
ncbi:MAG: hypothetical protein Q9196_006307, partial [Gyalolechia fulgens]